MKILLFIATVTLAFISCTTIIHGQYQTIKVSSNVEKREVFLNKKHVGYTPLELRVRRDSVAKFSELKIKAVGYVDTSFQIRRKLDPWYWANLVLGPGLIIDAVNGSMYKIKPSSINADLKKSHE